MKGWKNPSLNLNLVILGTLNKNVLFHLTFYFSYKTLWEWMDVCNFATLNDILHIVFNQYYPSGRSPGKIRPKPRVKASFSRYYNIILFPVWYGATASRDRCLNARCSRRSSRRHATTARTRDYASTRRYWWSSSRPTRDLDATSPSCLSPTVYGKWSCVI